MRQVNAAFCNQKTSLCYYKPTDWKDKQDFFVKFFSECRQVKIQNLAEPARWNPLYTAREILSLPFIWEIASVCSVMKSYDKLIHSGNKR